MSETYTRKGSAMGIEVFIETKYELQDSILRWIDSKTKSRGLRIVSQSQTEDADGIITLVVSWEYK